METRKYVLNIREWGDHLVASLSDASEAYLTLCRDSRLSADEWPIGIFTLFGNPRIVGFVSRSGDVWSRNPETTDRENNDLLYSPNEWAPHPETTQQEARA